MIGATQRGALVSRARHRRRWLVALGAVFVALGTVAVAQPLWAFDVLG
jgi:uncharacterized membrane protein HdeD (DUF308 family)